MNVSGLSLVPWTRSRNLPAAAPSTPEEATTRAGAFRQQIQVQAAGSGIVPSTEFRLVLDVKGDAAALNAALQPLGWTAAAADHGPTQITSPFLSVGNGGMERINEAMKLLSDNGAAADSQGALRIQLHDNVMDDRQLKQFVKSHMAQEDLIYTIAQNGSEGRGYGHKMTYAFPLSSEFKDTTEVAHADIRYRLSDPHSGVSTAEPSVLEFRYLDSTLNASAIQANVSLLLGQVDAAVSSRELGSALHAPANKAPKVDRARWEKFLNDSVGIGTLKAQIESQYLAAGGTVQYLPQMLPATTAIATPADLKQMLANTQAAQAAVAQQRAKMLGITKIAGMTTAGTGVLTVASLAVSHFTDLATGLPVTPIALGLLTASATTYGVAKIGADRATAAQEALEVQRQGITEWGQRLDLAARPAPRQAGAAVAAAARPANGGPAAAVAGAAANPRPRGAARPAGMTAFIASIPSAYRDSYRAWADRLQTARPDADDAFWAGVTAIFQRSNSEKGRDIKRQGLDHLLAIRPDISAASLQSIAASVNSIKGWEPRQQVMSALVGVYEREPGITDAGMAHLGQLITQGGASSVATLQQLHQQLDAGGPAAQRTRNDLRA